MKFIELYIVQIYHRGIWLESGLREIVGLQGSSVQNCKLAGNLSTGYTPLYPVHSRFMRSDMSDCHCIYAKAVYWDGS